MGRSAEQTVTANTNAPRSETICGAFLYANKLRGEDTIEKPRPAACTVNAGTVRAVCSRCVPFFTIHSSLFTIHFSCWEQSRHRSRPAACTANVGRATLPAPGGDWMRALPARRNMPARAPRRLHFLAICGIIADVPYPVLKPFRRTAGAFPEQPKG